MTESPEVQLQAARVARIDGRMTESEFLSVADRLGPQLGAAQLPSATKEQATDQLRALRQQRVEGKLTQEQFLAEMDRLGPTANPPPQLDESALAEIERMLAPAQHVHEYKFDGPAPRTEEEIALDTQTRQGLLDAGIPAQMGGLFAERINMLARNLGDASEQGRAQHVEAFQSQLQDKWGDKFAERSERVQEYLLQVADKNPFIGEILDAMPWVLADVGLNEMLHQVAEHRSRKRA